MLTKKDIQMIREALLEDFKQVFATKEELEDVRQELKHDILNFKIEILGEIQAIRQDLAVVIGYRQRIEDHEERITSLKEVPSIRMSTVT